MLYYCLKNFIAVLTSNLYPFDTKINYPKLCVPLKSPKYSARYRQIKHMKCKTIYIFGKYNEKEITTESKS